LPPEWRYAPAPDGGRDLRLDLLRGVCLFKMILNHLWRTPLHVVHLWTGFVSAAEGFFLISGVVVGIVHSRRIERHGWQPSAVQLWRRAAELAAANIALVLLLASIEVAGWLPVRPVAERFWNEGWGALFSFEHPYYLHVLPRYCVFLAVAPLVLWVLRRVGPALVVAASAALWAGNWLTQGSLALPMVETRAAEGFPSASWQLIFFLGLVIGASPSMWPRWLLHPGAVGACLVVWIGMVWWHLELVRGQWPLGAMGMWWTDRPLVAPVRIVNLLVAAVVCWWLVDRCWRPLSRFLGPVVMPFGRFALTAYLLHVVVVWLGLALLLRTGLVLHRQGWELVPVVAVAVIGMWWLLRREALAGWVPR
jgi:hypothetical protein